MKKYTVEFYFKGKPKDARSFETFEEAKKFMGSLVLLDYCEAYGLKRG